MQFRVPQFIDIEDKILGPLTWKQAAYCLGAAGVTYISLRFTGSKILGLLIASPFAAIFLALAFVKINNQSFVEVMEHAINYYAKTNLYTWRKVKQENIETKQVVQHADNKDLIPKSNRTNLKDLALGLDTRVDNN